MIRRCYMCRHEKNIIPTKLGEYLESNPTYVRNNEGTTMGFPDTHLYIIKMMREITEYEYSIADCEKALEECDGNMEQAIKVLHKWYAPIG